MPTPGTADTQVEENTMNPRNAYATWIGVSLLGLAFGTRLAAQPPSFDGRGSTIGNQQKTARETLTEYVLPGQTVDTWQELVTSTVFSQAVPIAPFVERIHTLMAKDCPSLVWNVIRQDEKTAVFEFHDAGCGGFPPQHELDRVTIEPDGLYRLAYAAKVKAPLAADKRKQWLAILTQTPIVERTATAADGMAKPAGAAAPGSGMTAAQKLSADQLAAGVRKAGWPCTAPVKSEVKGQTPGPAGLLIASILECAGGQRYTVLVDPSGAITSFPTPQ
jgi:hypothetical protein